MKKTLLLPLLLLLAGKALAQQTDCPRIYKVQDTLKTDPAPSYQWYKNGALIPNADKIWYRPMESADYSVTVGATSNGYTFNANPADLKLEVFDAKLKPVANATVTVNDQTTTTDENGRAFIAGVVSGRTVIKVVKSGYFDGFTSVYSPAAGLSMVRLQLEKFPSALTFQDTAKAMVAAPSGLTLTFPPHAFKNESTGEAYNGEVKIYFNHRAPENDAMFSFAMPGGDFTAIDANGQTVALTSYGFFNAELRGANGEELNLKQGVNADVQFRIPEAMRVAAPPSMPLWSFDEAAGIWKYDSELTKSGIFYKGTVSHFSSWNCDYAGPACVVKASAIDCNGNPASGSTLCFVDGVCGTTDSNGNVTFHNVPANRALTLYSSQSRINIGPINTGQTFTVAEPLQGGESMTGLANYWQDSVEVFVFGEDQPVQYSLDGQNWQNEPLFTGVPFQDSILVWIKDVTNCPITRQAQYARERASFSCIAAENSVQAEQFYTTFTNLLNWTLPLYTLSGTPIDAAQLSWACNQYSCLYTLYLAGSGIASIPAEIGNLKALWYLNLNNNQLTSLPAEIGNLTALTYLDSYNNQLASLPAEIGNLNALTGVDLSNNQLTSLPAEIGNLNALKELWLSSNLLASLPTEIWNLSTLTKLSLDGNQLTSIPTTVGNLTNLKELWLSNNQLDSLPASIGNLKSLTGLMLSSNKFSALPAEVWNLDSLTFLPLSSNHFTFLPAEIGNLNKLTNLWLENNQLTSLPAEIGNLNKLTNLWLDNNQLTYLPAEIGNLEALMWLKIPYNQLTALPAEIANLADTLQTLDLRDNPIPVGDRPYYQSLLPNTYIMWE